MREWRRREGSSCSVTLAKRPCARNRNSVSGSVTTRVPPHLGSALSPQRHGACRRRLLLLLIHMVVAVAAMVVRVQRDVMT